jgi:undecaprenyl-diphosphatase
MDFYQVIVLALLQGLTEFLPVSSSGHLLIPSLVFGWTDQGQTFDVAVHVGTLSAVLMYFRTDLLRMADRWVRTLAGAPACEDSRMVWYLAFATLPAGVVGLLADDFIESHLRMLPVVATTTLVFGLLLGLAERRARMASSSRPLTLTVALLVGCAQVMALVPGVSRSGVTMTAAVLLGLDRKSAARFSFLLSVPIIASAGLLKTMELTGSEAIVDWVSLALGAAVSGVTAYICIAAFFRLLDKIGFMPFVYYRIALAAVLYFLWLT